jgi:hypothetical protein
MEEITMIFDDLFYPGNPKRRQEVANLRGEIIVIFENYKAAWNDNADLLNGIFAQVKDSKYAGLTLLTLKKNIESDAVGDCINEINAVISDTKNKLDKLVEDIGLSKLLPADWKEKGCTIDQIGAENVRKIGQIVSGLASSAAAAFVGYYVFTGVTVAIGLVQAVAGVVSGMLSMCGGVLAGIVLGGAAFVITDLISSAITGAIERKELNEAIDALKKLKSQIDPCLTNATVKLAGITQSIKDGVYLLDETHLLLKKPDGSYTVIETSTSVKTSTPNMKLLSSEPKEEILFLTA